MATVLPLLRCAVKCGHTACMARTSRTPVDAAATPAVRSPGRPKVPFDRIVATALQIVDDEGADALSMRVLAQRLDSGTATLYRHVSNRAELIAHVIDRVLGEIEYPPDDSGGRTWQEDCAAGAHAMFDALSRHKNVAPLLADHVPIGPNAMLHRERVLSRLLASGFTPELAAKTHATVARYVLGFAVQLRGDDASNAQESADLSAHFHYLDPETFPSTYAVADVLPIPLHDEFEFGLRMIISGVTDLYDGRGRHANVGKAVRSRKKPE
ncbi:TetR/AcrR family transcriptional regulator C-terminal domain-containing protein [Mycobacterium sp. 360MFTsu5.1]|uniref:TetR/AcrR family transcriptional regulator n=1 Tax=Mycobacterium sp. 360MFTsu5.1 TaxID=1172186 RepID=UPI001E626D90|nr:TetR/AcrR family transcriptional regulator C-terminal domain-containing protein [Mycobacterium sp. 360MFTsu5.1]